MSAQPRGNWKAVVDALLAVGVFGALAAFVVNALVGTESYAAPLGDAIGPAKLWWWVVLPGLLFSAYHVWGFARGAELALPWQATMAAFVYGFFLLFWLWLHDAEAYLYPALSYTLAALGSVALHSDWTSEPTKQLATENGAAADASLGAGPEEFPARKPLHSFAEVEGMHEVKERLLAFGREALLTERETPKPRNGALLSGDPGNGKTFLAEALAGELGIAFLPVSIATLERKYVGEKTERLKRLFERAVAQAPCMLFIDEIDSLLGDRGAMHDAVSETPRAVNALLTELVNVRGKRVVLVAATNYPEKLDAAGVREGRFDLKLEIPPPDFAARLGLLRRGIPREIRLADGTLVRVSEGVLEMAACHFAGFSVARLMQIACTVREGMAGGGPGRNEVRFACLLWALRQAQGVANAGLPEGVPALRELVLKPNAREQLERLAAMMRDIEAAERAGGAIQPGIVFHGPPGTGKTLAAKALAKDTGWTFVATTGHDLISAEDAMEKTVARAADLRPAILFIDEADDILADRTYAPHTKMATNKLLSLLDGAEGRPPDVLFVAATNNPRAFDAAALRRFPIKVEFALPDAAEIRSYLEKWRGGLKLPVEADFDLGEAVRVLAGKSMADIRVALQEAVNMAALRRMTEPGRGLRAADLARAACSLSLGESLPT